MTKKHKTYVLDTNVLLHDPNALFAFEEHDVVIPIVVIEEIDKFKREGSERGRNARTVARLLDELRERDKPLSAGVALGNGGRLRVALPKPNRQFDPALDPHKADHKILQTALELKQERERAGEGADVHATVLVTMDTNLRILADAVGVASENYLNERVQLDELDRGWMELTVRDEDIDTLFREKELEPPDVEDLYPNVYLQLVGIGTDRSALARYDARVDRIVPLRVPSDVMGIQPRNREQRFALDMLLNDDIKLVTLVGKAGTGKTLLALAAALKRTVQDHAFSRVLVSRPVVPLGRDLGYLPGSVDEKLNPWLQPIYDNIDQLVGENGAGRKGLDIKQMSDEGLLQVEPLTYIRGRSLPTQYLIVDEAQNLTPHEVKTIITRSGEGTKVVLTGDPYQIDNPYVDASSNGLTIVADRFLGQQLAAHVLLGKGERSDLAELASDLL